MAEVKIKAPSTERYKIQKEIFARAAEFHAGQGYEQLVEMIRDDIINWGISKVRSVSKLSDRQMVALAREYRLRNDGIDPGVPVRRSHAHDPSGPVSDDQARLMDELFEELGMDARARAAFCAHTIKGYLANRGEPGRELFWPQDRGQGNAVIEGLKAVKRRRRKSG